MSSGETEERTRPDFDAVAILRDTREFAALEGAWEELLHDSPLQSWAWLYSWWENYG